MPTSAAPSSRSKRANRANAPSTTPSPPGASDSGLSLSCSHSFRRHPLSLWVSRAKGRESMSGKIWDVIAIVAMLVLAGLRLLPAPAQAQNEPAPVAQRAVLYEEDLNDSKGQQYAGSVVWRTEPVKANGNQPAGIAVRADIDIPDRKLKMTMSFRRNTDASLPASHVVELIFKPQDFAGGGVTSVPGMLMKTDP